MDNIVYIKKVDEYNDIVKGRYYKIPIFFKKLVFIYKNIFNKITKKNVENKNIWVLPFLDKYSKDKIENIIKKMSIYNENTYVLPTELISLDVYKLLDKYNIKYIDGSNLKKYLVIKILEHIIKIQNKEINGIELTILAKDVSKFNVFLIEKLSKIVKSIKVVTPNIYKFKRLEEKLYNEFGIAIQLSNSYKKSLVKSKIIINLDYNSIDINEYEIFNKAIIINCFKEDIKIKSKLFNGIVTNSCNINFKKEIRDEFRKTNIYHKYNNLALYESYINKEKSIEKILEKLNEDKVLIQSLIGNNGIIDKNEFKNIFKKLDK